MTMAGKRKIEKKIAAHGGEGDRSHSTPLLSVRSSPMRQACSTIAVTAGLMSQKTAAHQRLLTACAIDPRQPGWDQQ